MAGPGKKMRISGGRTRVRPGSRPALSIVIECRSGGALETAPGEQDDLPPSPAGRRQTQIGSPPTRRRAAPGWQQGATRQHKEER